MDSFCIFDIKKEAIVLEKGYRGKYINVEFLLKNTADVPAYPVTIDAQ